jgi:hypothetical protein
MGCTHSAAHDIVENVSVVTPQELLANRLMTLRRRVQSPVSGIDRCDIARLLIRFLELRLANGPIIDRLRELTADEVVLALWRTIVSEEIQPDDDGDEC